METLGTILLLAILHIGMAFGGVFSLGVIAMCNASLMSLMGILGWVLVAGLAINLVAQTTLLIYLK